MYIVTFAFAENGIPTHLKVLVAKPGTCEFNDSCIEVKIQPIFSRVVEMFNPRVRARRKQLPVDNADCSTIHKVCIICISM